MRSPILEPRRLRRPVLEKAAKPNFRAKKAAAKQKKAESCRRWQNAAMEEKNIEGSSGIQNGLGKLNRSKTKENMENKITKWLLFLWIVKKLKPNILKLSVPGVWTPQIIFNFPQKDWLRMQKL